MKSKDLTECSKLVWAFAGPGAGRDDVYDVSRWPNSQRVIDKHVKPFRQSF